MGHVFRGFPIRFRYDLLACSPPLADLTEALASGDDVRGLLAITFDDGYLDNVECAAPVLADYKLPESLTIVPAIPRNGSGKIDRNALEEMVTRRQPDLEIVTWRRIC